MRRLVKFVHTLASSGLIGAFLGYALILAYATPDDTRAYADARQTISLICSILLLPSLGLALITGLLSMVVHRAFLDTRWAWLKALLGMSMFEATFAIVQSKATTAAAEAAKVLAGEGDAELLSTSLSNEWMSLAALLALSAAQVALGVWRPRLEFRQT